MIKDSMNQEARLNVGLYYRTCLGQWTKSAELRHVTPKMQSFYTKVSKASQNISNTGVIIKKPSHRRYSSNDKENNEPISKKIICLNLWNRGVENGIPLSDVTILNALIH
jgi:hypothetical protein